MAGKKGAAHATDEEIREFRALRARGWSAGRCARELGFSESWGYSLQRKLERERKLAERGT